MLRASRGLFSDACFPRTRGQVGGDSGRTLTRQIAAEEPERQAGLTHVTKMANVYTPQTVINNAANPQARLEINCCNCKQKRIRMRYEQYTLVNIC